MYILDDYRKKGRRIFVATFAREFSQLNEFDVLGTRKKGTACARPLLLLRC
jgi:hypothetical protein